MSAPIDIYEEMSILSSRMVDAARTSDWDLLVELETTVSELRVRLESEEESIALSTHDRERKRIMIQEILAKDAEIRSHTEPWMERMRRFLCVSTKTEQI